MIFAYFYTGFLSAVFVALVIWLILRCFEIYSGKIWKSADLRLLILPLAAGLTLFTGDFLYFQLLPSAWCVMTAAEQSAGLLLKKAHLFPGENGDTAFSKDELKLARFGILGASLIALLISEYFRQTLSLSSWIWYYGYLRLELLPIMLGSIAPAMVRMIRRSEKEAG
ncbi:hypothetical protein [uncultured Roseobacter sp.]|uniref:hypothetical protein n=1 Tax=uncultured Roseobacter sp. TaxID=114847 RepID=UPI002609972D|nr:hypothetical protein [uncultured Roseobacter sp.]